MFLFKKFIILYRFKKFNPQDFIVTFNRISSSSISNNFDHLLDLNDLDDDFILAFRNFTKNDNLDLILKIIKMNYYIDLLILNKYEVKLVDNKSISVFKQRRYHSKTFNDKNPKNLLIKDSSELKKDYIKKIKDL